MKTQRLLTPLAMALSAVLSVGAFAGGHSGNSGHSSASGAAATINDNQVNQYNSVNNQATENTAEVNGSLGGASGNVGVNVAAGDNNQQANAAAIATSDALFVFGGSSAASAQASIDVYQQNNNNNVTNQGVPNTAALNDSGAGASGNLGINIAAGTSNQQKNDMAIASSETAYTAGATVDVNQNSAGNNTSNLATVEYSQQYVSLSLSADGDYNGV